MILRYAARNLMRHRTRTVLTTLAVVLTVGLIIVANTLLDGLNAHVLSQFSVETGHVRLQNPQYEKESRFAPLDHSIGGRRAISERLLALPSVVRVQPRIRFGMLVQYTDKSTVLSTAILDDPATDEDTLTDEQIFGKKTLEMTPGVAIQPSMERGGLADRVVDGSYFSSDTAEEVLIGVELARRLGVGPGADLEILTTRGGIRDLAARVVGVFDFGNRIANRSCYVPIGRVEALLDMPDEVTELLVFGDNYRESGQVLTEVVSLGLGDAIRVKEWSDIGLMQTVTPLFDAILGLLLFAILAVAVAGLLNTMLMSVMERQKEIGVLQALGMDRSRIVVALLLEAVIFAAVGSAVGMLAGVGLANILVQHGIHIGVEATQAFPMAVSETIYGELNGLAVIRAGVIGILVALVGAVGPAISATRKDPMEAMRS